MQEKAMIEIFKKDEIYTIKEVAVRLKIKVSGIRDRIFKGTIPFYKLGNTKNASVRFYGEELNKWLIPDRRWETSEDDLYFSNILRQKSGIKTIEDYNQIVENLKN